MHTTLSPWKSSLMDPAAVWKLQVWKKLRENIFRAGFFTDVSACERYDGASRVGGCLWCWRRWVCDLCLIHLLTSILSHQKCQNWQPCTKWSFIIVFFSLWILIRPFPWASWDLTLNDDTLKLQKQYQHFVSIYKEQTCTLENSKTSGCACPHEVIFILLLTCSLKNKQSRGF